MKKSMLIGLENEYKNILDKYLMVVNGTIKNFDKNKSILIENYAYVLSHKIVLDIDTNYNIKIDMTIINNGIIDDMKKVILNYNESNKSILINFSVIEDIIMDDNLTNKTKSLKIEEYLKGIKINYLMENNFITKLNETFTKRIMTRILSNHPEITNEESKKIINEIYSSVKSESFGFVNGMNDSYVDMQSKITSITKKISEGMAQLEMLRPYEEKDTETELEFTSRISRMKQMNASTYDAEGDK